MWKIANAGIAYRSLSIKTKDETYHEYLPRYPLLASLFSKDSKRQEGVRENSDGVTVGVCPPACLRSPRKIGLEIDATLGLSYSVSCG